MKYSYALLSMIMFGLIGLVFIYMFESITINNESEYYTLKEAMEASMIESIDLACFRNSTANGCNGMLKISEQKFVENFTKRFSKSLIGDFEKYSIEFYDIMEAPPKATIVVREAKSYNAQGANKVSIDGSIDSSIVNNLTGILELDKAWKNGNVVVGNAISNNSDSQNSISHSNNQNNNNQNNTNQGSNNQNSTNQNSTNQNSTNQNSTNQNSNDSSSDYYEDDDDEDDEYYGDDEYYDDDDGDEDDYEDDYEDDDEVDDE